MKLIALFLLAVALTYVDAHALFDVPGPRYVAADNTDPVLGGNTIPCATVVAINSFPFQVNPGISIFPKKYLLLINESLLVLSHSRKVRCHSNFLYAVNCCR